MYTRKNFPTKKALKEAIKNGDRVTVYQPGLGPTPPSDGVVFLEGPHSPKMHSWYAEATLKNGAIVSVK